jgi:hypothetical protein
MHWFDQLYLKDGGVAVALVAFCLFSAAAALFLGAVERVILSFSRRTIRPTASGSPSQAVPAEARAAGDSSGTGAGDLDGADAK